MTPDERNEWIQAWLTTPAATEQRNKTPSKRACPACDLTCWGFYRFTVPCNPERDLEMTR